MRNDIELGRKKEEEWGRKEERDWCKSDDPKVCTCGQSNGNCTDSCNKK